MILLIKFGGESMPLLLQIFISFGRVHLSYIT